MNTVLKMLKDRNSVKIRYSTPLSLLSKEGNIENYGLLLGVENTVEIRQQRTKGQKSNEYNKNNRFVRRRSVVINVLCLLH